MCNIFLFRAIYRLISDGTELPNLFENQQKIEKWRKIWYVTVKENEIVENVWCNCTKAILGTFLNDFVETKLVDNTKRSHDISTDYV